ncbi:hypothetical protein HJC23_006495 [Cyclotella cryptica]|uniref:Small-subunit processome Utp12 domain-containing protein n=1 Tax=Cyclotella cryptica TaxID=29204 RepID=A0ABD3PNV6_9STRA|eukprot:CCRYP_012987-RA/>CCRYP_012987-RA protein AED:0.08 eAED:0.08 QI:0/-1/0/1/-1/1/1/0/666
MTFPPPLTAYSPNGTLIALANSNASKSGLIRCYDSTAASLKFTLRLPKTKSGDDDGGDPPALRKLVFASDQYLCGWQCDSSTLIVWDLDRGVPSHVIDVSTSERKKKKRKSGDGEETGIVCDIAARSAKLFALVYFPSHDKGKCRVMQYDLNSSEGRLEKKIKVGSVHGSGGGRGMGLAVSSTGTMAIRMDNVLKVHDFNGEKLCKMDSIPSWESTEGTSAMEYSKDGSYLVVSGGNGSIMAFHINKNDNQYKLQPMAVLKPKSDGLITSLDTIVSSKTIGVLAFQAGVGGSYFLFPSTEMATTLDGMVPQVPTATIQTKVENALISSGFHPIRKSEMLFLFRHASTAPGSGTTLPMETLSYNDANGTGVSGTIFVRPPSEHDVTAGEGNNKKKRKAANEVALPPGEQGMEASMTTDLTLAKKKKTNITTIDDDGENDVNMNSEEEDDFKLEEDEDGEHGQSIAERLAMLSSAMEQTDEEEEDDEDEDEDSIVAKAAKQQSSAKSKFNIKSATSESLTTLLTQALSSNDSIQLNIALQVTDRRMVENTVRALQLLDAQREDRTTEGFVPMLMGHIVRRIARRHTLVTPLGVWIKAILLSTSQISSRHLLDGNAANITDEQEERMIQEGRELALKLGPLRNFLNERVECFPQLLRLEGRLALLSQQL